MRFLNWVLCKTQLKRSLKQRLNGVGYRGEELSVVVKMLPTMILVHPSDVWEGLPRPCFCLVICISHRL